MPSNRHYQGESGSGRRRANRIQPQTSRPASALLERLTNLDKLFLYHCKEKNDLESKHNETVDRLQSLVAKAQHKLSNRQSDQDIFNIFAEYRKALTQFEIGLESMRKLSQELAETARKQEEVLVEITRGQNNQQEDN